MVKDFQRKGENKTSIQWTLGSQIYLGKNKFWSQKYFGKCFWPKKVFCQKKIDQNFRI